MHNQTVTGARLDNAPLTGEAGHVGFDVKWGLQPQPMLIVRAAVDVPAQK